MILKHRQYIPIPHPPSRYRPPSDARCSGREIQRFADKIRGMLGGTWLYWVPHLDQYMLGHMPKHDGKIHGIRGFDVNTEFTDRLAENTVRSIRISERTSVNERMRQMDWAEKSRLHDAEEERDRELYDQRHEIEESFVRNANENTYGKHHKWSAVVNGTKGK